VLEIRSSFCRRQTSRERKVYIDHFGDLQDKMLGSFKPHWTYAPEMSLGRERCSVDVDLHGNRKVVRIHGA